MTTSRAVSLPRTLVLSVTLRRIRPLVRWRFTIRDDARFDERHDVLQAVTGGGPGPT